MGLVADLVADVGVKLRWMSNHVLCLFTRSQSQSKDVFSQYLLPTWRSACRIFNHIEFWGERDTD